MGGTCAFPNKPLVMLMPMATLLCCATARAQGCIDIFDRVTEQPEQRAALTPALTRSTEQPRGVWGRVVGRGRGEGNCKARGQGRNEEGLRRTSEATPGWRGSGAEAAELHCI